MQLLFVNLQGLVEAGAMETVQLSSHSETLLGSVGSANSSLPLIESVYHLFNFFLARVGGRRGELCFMGCQSEAAHSIVLQCVEGCSI